MTYHQAIAKGYRVSCCKATGLPLLALTIATLADFHAVDPRVIYDAAVARGLTVDEVRRLSIAELVDLMFT